MTACLLTLIATPEFEEKLVDWLISTGHEGFTTARCQGHGVQHVRLSAPEQVAGRQHRVAFWLLLSESEARRPRGRFRGLSRAGLPSLALITVIQLVPL